MTTDEAEIWPNKPELLALTSVLQISILMFASKRKCFFVYDRPFVVWPNILCKLKSGIQLHRNIRTQILCKQCSKVEIKQKKIIT